MSEKMTAYDTIIQGGTVVTAADSVAALGTIAVGADVDIAIWDADKEVTITWDALHDDVGDTPNEGMTIKGWPVTVLRRGRVVVEDGELKVDRGSGTFLAQGRSEAARPLRRLAPEMDPARKFGADILPGARGD